jgi:hypothetical protein
MASLTDHVILESMSDGFSMKRLTGRSGLFAFSVSM